MYIYTLTTIYIHIHTCIRTHTYVYIYTPTHTYIHIHTCIHTHTHMYIYTHLHTYTYIYIHAYTHTHMYMLLPRRLVLGLRAVAHRAALRLHGAQPRLGLPLVLRRLLLMPARPLLLLRRRLLRLAHRHGRADFMP